MNWEDKIYESLVDDKINQNVSEITSKLVRKVAGGAQEKAHATEKQARSDVTYHTAAAGLVKPGSSAYTTRKKAQLGKAEDASRTASKAAKKQGKIDAQRDRLLQKLTLRQATNRPSADPKDTEAIERAKKQDPKGKGFSTASKHADTRKGGHAPYDTH